MQTFSVQSLLMQNETEPTHAPDPMTVFSRPRFPHDAPLSSRLPLLMLTQINI